MFKNLFKRKEKQTTCCFCPRCRRLYKSYNVKHDPDKINVITASCTNDRRAYTEHGFMHLCPECSDELIELMKWFKKEGEL